jgi:hypothetical protein
MLGKSPGFSVNTVSRLTFRKKEVQLALEFFGGREGRDSLMSAANCFLRRRPKTCA